MLKELLLIHLDTLDSDEQIITMFKQVRTLQTNGTHIEKAIELVCTTSHTPIRISTKHLHADNTPARLAIRHRATLRKYRTEGYGYGKISKLLAQRGTYNKDTGKAYSRATVQRACNLIENKETTNG